MPDEVMENLIELIRAGMSDDVLKVWVTEYWKQVNQVHIVVASVFGWLFLVVGGVIAWTCRK